MFKKILILLLFLVSTKCYSIDTLKYRQVIIPVITSYSDYIERSISVTYSDSTINIFYNFITPNNIEVKVYASDFTLVFDRKFDRVTLNYLTIARVWEVMYIIINDRDFGNTEIIFKIP
mgnify:FL=1